MVKKWEFVVVLKKVNGCNQKVFKNGNNEIVASTQSSQTAPPPKLLVVHQTETSLCEVDLSSNRTIKLVLKL